MMLAFLVASILETRIRFVRSWMRAFGFQGIHDSERCMNFPLAGVSNVNRFLYFRQSLNDDIRVAMVEPQHSPTMPMFHTESTLPRFHHRRHPLLIQPFYDLERMSASPLCSKTKSFGP